LYKIIIKGTVQGVGFRPYIYNQATKKNITGYIQNSSNGVEIISNEKEKILKILKKSPKNIKIKNIEINKIQTKTKYSNFTIKQSKTNSKSSNISTPADLSICKNCIKDILEKNNPRQNYFATTCTNCGPRYSIINSLPFDRKNTSLNKFKKCNFCKQEYENPKNRRFHAQTICCPKCGPQLTLYKNNKEIKTNDPIKYTANLIKKNKIIAIKGIGGFHIASNINNKTIKKLKLLTQRQHKPFALMAKNIDMIKKYCTINPIEKQTLLSTQKPIVLLTKINHDKHKEISELNSLGFMLPYTPTHYLLFKHLNEPIILTSSNLPSNPITTKKEEQFVKYVLDYNREITNFNDDSIIKIINKKPIFIRKSRGYAIESFDIPFNYQTTKNNILARCRIKKYFCN